VTIGYRAHFPEIEVKVLARGASSDQAHALATKAAAIVKERLAAVLFAEGPSSFPIAVAALLQEKNLSLAFAESCTGGLASSLGCRLAPRP
jgi:nicotinamide-nucleotide amidase